MTGFSNIAAFGKTSTAPAPTYLINEDCEGTGTPANWTDAGTVDWDYTANVINGIHSVRCSSPISSSTYASYASQSTVYFKSRFRVLAVDTGGSYAAAIQIQSAASTVIYAFSLVRSTGTISNARIVTTAAQATSTQTLAANTNYYIWGTFVSGGTCDLAISASNSKPSSDSGGNVYVTCAGGVATATKFVIRCAGTGSDYVFDDMQVDDVLIP